MSDDIYPVPAEWAHKARTDGAGYAADHACSLANPEIEDADVEVPIYDPASSPRG